MCLVCLTEKEMFLGVLLFRFFFLNKIMLISLNYYLRQPGN